MNDDNDTTKDVPQVSAELRAEIEKLNKRIEKQLAPLRQHQEQMAQIAKKAQEASKPLVQALSQFQQAVGRFQLDPKVTKGLSEFGEVLRRMTEQAGRDYAPQVQAIAQGLTDRAGDRVAELEERVSQLEAELTQLRGTDESND